MRIAPESIPIFKMWNKQNVQHSNAHIPTSIYYYISLISIFFARKTKKKFGRFLILNRLLFLSLRFHLYIQSKNLRPTLLPYENIIRYNLFQNVFWILIKLWDHLTWNSSGNSGKNE